MSQDITPEEIENNSTQGNNNGDAKPPANTWPKIVAAVASALCTVSSTLYFTMKNQYETERADKLQLEQSFKIEKSEYEKQLREQRNIIDSCGIKTISQLRQQVEAVKDLKLSVTSNVNEVITESKITSENIKNIKKATKEITRKINRNE